jgi:hypothetical protein
MICYGSMRNRGAVVAVCVSIIVDHHAKTPMLACDTQRAIQDPGSRLHGQISPVPASLHLLPLGRALADHRIHCRPNEVRGGPFTGLATLSIVDQASCLNPGV